MSKGRSGLRKPPIVEPTTSELLTPEAEATPELSTPEPTISAPKPPLSAQYTLGIRVDGDVFEEVTNDNIASGKLDCFAFTVAPEEEPCWIAVAPNQ